MEEATTITAAKAPSEAGSFAEHKKLRAAPPAEKEKAAAAAGKQNTEIAPSAGDKQNKSEIAPATDTGGENKSQEKKKPHEDEGVKARFSELSRDRKLAIERAEKAERELEELRKGGTRKPEDTAKPETKTAAAPQKPKLSDFENDGKYKSYSEAIDAYQDARYEWEREDAKAQRDRAELERQANDARQTATQKVTKAREKYADFDQVTAGDPTTGEGLLLHNGVFQALLAADDGMDVLYEAGKLPAEEKQRIAKLNPASQLFELARIQARGAKPSEKEKPAVTPVTKAPPPPTPVTGVAAAAPKSTSEARSMDEHRRLRQAGRS